MEVQDEVLDLMFDLTYKVTNYVRNNRHCKDGPRIKDVMLFKTIYKAENYQITMSELANILGVSAAAVSQMIAGFEKKGLLQRVHSNTDRRTVYIQIVPEAIEMFQKRMDTHVENVYRFLDYLGSEDCAHLRDILKKTARYMEENK
ncbi:MarR family winged helix-turn-helix transcriptional regulator [Holdemanella biformis]|uniref:MarR family winged helix-turn-helix transcriptional regulator n=1 Tax=Holdemanella biformis TaxID=1735 RepID=UPI003A9124B4